MSEPRKHHYIPVCYLKQWADTKDRRLCEYKLDPGGHGVRSRRTSPSGTGYKIDLYRIHGVPNEIAQDFEKQFMSLVDTDASGALEKIIAGETDNWPGARRSGWTRFILSLLFRNPEAVATIKGHIIQMWDEGTKALQADHAARRRAGDPETVEEFLAKHEPNAAQIDAANFLADVIDNDRVGKTVFEMKWSRIDLSKSTHQLLTSLPVSPRILFVAAHKQGMADALRKADPTDIVRKNNRCVIEQARKFVWGSTDSQIAFVRKHFGKLPDRELLTDQQRQEAIEAARGKKTTSRLNGQFRTPAFAKNPRRVMLRPRHIRTGSFRVALRSRTGGLLMAAWSDVADRALLTAAVAFKYHWPNVAASLERDGHGARTAQACEHRLRLLLERERSLRKEHLRRLVAEPVTRAKRTIRPDDPTKKPPKAASERIEHLLTAS